MSVRDGWPTFSVVVGEDHRWRVELSTLAEVRKFEREHHVHQDRFTVSAR